MKISDTVVGAGVVAGGGRTFTRWLAHPTLGVGGPGFVAVGALIFTGTLNYPTLEAGHPGPSLFPRLLAGLMAVFGGFLSVQGIRARDVTDEVAWLRLH